MRIKDTISWLVVLVLVSIGVTALAAFFLLGQDPENTATNNSDPNGFNVPDIDAEQQDAQDTGGPQDKSLSITVPKMDRVEDATVPDAAGDDEEALGDYAAIHLKGTGFPWQEEANVYLAGHRLGYPNTESFLAFWDLDELQNGDEVFVEDADGTEYNYRVFDSFIVNPDDTWVIDPVPGKNILTLQTCTLPDYSQRLIVQAELVSRA
ncbi:MAG: class E sortase [Rubrobacteraceae bacterium]